MNKNQIKTILKIEKKSQCGGMDPCLVLAISMSSTFIKRRLLNMNPDVNIS